MHPAMIAELSSVGALLSVIARPQQPCLMSDLLLGTSMVCAVTVVGTIFL